MIRKVARIEAPVEVVLEIFRDTDAWPQWMPGVASTRVLEEGDGRRLVEVILLVLGRRQVQKLECSEQDGQLTHRQVEGWFRKWEAVWTFRPPPEGGGTIVSLRLDFDLGLAGYLIPRHLIGGWVQSVIDDTVKNGRRRAQRFALRRREPTEAVAVGQPVLQVFATADGFEVIFAGRTFHLDARESVAGERR